ncbi:MAG: hypothetical protein GXP55_10285, partial [Deltaproteobacteria bacterium]|nr:hypothetical protein [Deltaproteobacteria bacterium]
TTRRDASAADAGNPVDGSPADSGGLDAGTRDAGPADAGLDTGTRDAGLPDAGSTSSGGSGGAFPGAQTRSAPSAGGDVPYALYIPTSYAPGRPMALLSVFHGQGDSGANMRDFWTSTAEANGFIVLATSSTGSSGGWVPAADVPRYDAALTDARGAYAIDTSRLYLWGFSAGAHLTHAIGLENAGTFAAYSVSAGVLAALEGVDGPTRASRRIPVDIHIGTDDPLFPQAASDRNAFLAAGWREGTDLSYVTFAGGHTLRAAQLPEIWAFLSRFRSP